MGHAMKSEIGFSKKHLDCGMNMPMDHSDTNQDNQEDPKSCCENITEHLQVDEDFQLKKIDISVDLTFAVALVEVFIFGTEPIETDHIAFSNYTSPPLKQDLPVLFKQFLI